MEKLFVSWPEWLAIHLYKGLPLRLIAEIEKKPFQSIVEIGVFQGCFSKLLRSFFPQAHLHLVDPWKIYPAYRKDTAGPITLKQYEMTKAYKIVQETFGSDPLTSIHPMTSLKAAKLISDDLDLVYIDGNHDYSFVKQDIETWLPKVRPGGYLCGDDYVYGKFPGVIQAVEEHRNSNTIIFPSGFWVIKRPLSN
jgi:hypothetical protein